MTPITTAEYSITFNRDAYKTINEHLKQEHYSKLFIIVDTNSHTYCLPQFLGQLETETPIEVIEIESGETNKTIDTCVGVWNALTDLNADRKSLVINLGGGVVTDLGGFVASTYKRGMAFINVPTTLLAMVDASVGGKTGVDLGHLKNLIGVINNPKLVAIDTMFLDSLPPLQLRSGFAEMLKHGLITSPKVWDTLNDIKQLTLDDLDALIHESITIKHNIVLQDPTEQGLRKVLNFGHTVGHAIETYFLSDDTKTPLLHGDAIAIGMIVACYLSHKTLAFPLPEVNAIKAVIKGVFGHVDIHTNDYQDIIELLKFDKKNTYGNINFVLLKAIGEPQLDCQVDEPMIIEALNFYAK